MPIVLCIAPTNPHVRRSRQASFLFLFVLFTFLTPYPVDSQATPSYSEQHLKKLLSQRKYPDAERYLRQILQHQPTPLIYYRLSRVLMRQYRYTEAEDFLRKAIEADPNRPDLHRWLYYLSHILNEQNQCSAAIALLEQSISLQASATYYYQKAKCALNIGNFAMAEQDLRSTLQAQPRHAYALYRLGRLFVDQGDTDAALPLLQQAVEVKPDNVEAHFMLGLAQRSVGQIEAAISSMRTVVAQLPGHIGASYNLGLLLAQTGQKQESQSFLREFRHLHPIQEKIERLKQSVLMAPNLPKTRIAIGKLYLEIGRIDEAVIHFEAARRLAPQMAQVHHLLTQAYTHQGQSEKAAEAQRFAVSLASKDTASLPE